MEQDLKLAILGADGRMGRAVISALSERQGLSLCAALTHSQSPHLGQDAVALAGVSGDPVILTDDLSQAKICDVAIDFSAPLATLAFVDITKNSQLRSLVSGTTGFTHAQNQNLRSACEGISLLQSGNFSLGVNMLEALVELAASKLNQGWDIDVLEMHHKHKVDAPSGTALMLGSAAAKGRGVPLEAVQKLSREGQTGKRPEGEIGFATLRGGGVIGEHSVHIASELEMLTLSHSAFDRSVFAHGAISAALWAAKQTPGKYDMKDMLGL
jgi:4-hydroxy-tetrahydrodipicolinate reductase